MLRLVEARGDPGFACIPVPSGKKTLLLGFHLYITLNIQNIF